MRARDLAPREPVRAARQSAVVPGRRDEWDEWDEWDEGPRFEDRGSRIERRGRCPEEDGARVFGVVSEFLWCYRQRLWNVNDINS